MTDNELELIVEAMETHTESLRCILQILNDLLKMQKMQAEINTCILSAFGLEETDEVDSEEELTIQ